jgi:hypothetical protein
VTIVSDFTPRILERIDAFPEPFPVSRFNVLAPADPSPINNLTLTDISAMMPTAKGPQITATVRNQGNEKRTVGVQVSILDTPLAREEVEVPAGRSQSVVLRIEDIPPEDGSIPVTVSLLSDDGLEADNHQYAGIGFPEMSDEHVLILCADEREAFLVQTALEVLGSELGHTQYTVQVMPYNVLNSSSLQAADTVIITSAAPALTKIVSPLRDFVTGGGLLVLFAHRNQDQDTLALMNQEGILAAFPADLRNEAATLATSVVRDAIPGNSDALGALENYGFEDYVFDAWYSCQGAAGAKSQWPMENGESLLYRNTLGAGETVFLNFSADDSLSNLMKSPAALPLHNYLLGSDDRLLSIASEAGDPTSISHTWSAGTTIPDTLSIQIIAPSGAIVGAHYKDGTIAVPPIREIGIAKVRVSPTLYMGLNIPEGETNLRPATPEIIASTMEKLFVESEHPGEATSGGSKTKQRHFGNWFLVAGLTLLLFETFVSNRMVR